MAVIAPAALAGCSPLARSGPIGKDSTMAQDMKTRIAGDGPELALSSSEVGLAGQALAVALNDRSMIAASRAPQPMLAWLDGSYSPAQVGSSGDVRAGQWLLTSAAEGPMWVMRVATPAPPRMGMLFEVPMMRDQNGFRATALRFVRVR
jgi:hypothetical protein